MSEWGLTYRGFRRKAYYDIISSMEQKARDLFGAEIDLSSASPLALFLRVVAFGLSLLWAVAESVYHASYVDTASGQTLDYIVKYAGISRRAATPARRVLRFTGDPGTIIPQGFLVETEDGPPRFATIYTAAIEGDGRVTILAEADEPGTTGNVAAGTLTAIVNPIPGVISVANIESEADVYGLDRESDHELRERYYSSLAKGGASTRDAILAAILEVPGVRTARVFHNTTMSIDDDGRPPKSVEAVVFGGSIDDVGRAIHNTIAAGIESHGDVEAAITDASGQAQMIRFNRAEVVDIYVSADVVRSALYPLDGDDQVRDAIIKYIGGTDTQGINHRGLELGQAVIWTAMIQAVRNVPGVQDVAILIGTAPEPTETANITMNHRQVAETTPDKVVVSSV